jgi:hypothetical protein
MLRSTTSSISMVEEEEEGQVAAGVKGRGVVRASIQVRLSTPGRNVQPC